MKSCCHSNKDSCHYDLIIIDTGASGMAGAIKAAELDKNVAIIESGTIGGACVNIGCIPSKMLINAAKVYYTANIFNGNIKANWQELIERKNELVRRLRQKKYIEVLEHYKENITLIRGDARLKSDKEVLVNGKSYNASKIIVAVGASPKIPEIPGIKNVKVLTSTTAMELEKLPNSLLIIGGRAIALELGQMFSRFGVKVAILQRSKNILPEHELELSSLLKESLYNEGVNIYTGVKINKIWKEGENKRISGEVEGEKEEFQADEILMATGVTPNIRGIGLLDCGVELNSNGFIKVNEFLQTTNPNIYAAGDVTSLPKLVYVAAKSGGIASENALSGNMKKIDLSVIPEVTFTDPQVATVGLTESQAREVYSRVKVAVLAMEEVPIGAVMQTVIRAIAEQNAKQRKGGMSCPLSGEVMPDGMAGDAKGFIKLVINADNDTLVGAHILSEKAGEVIETASLAIQFGKRYNFTINDLCDNLFPYLTEVEGLKLAALTFKKPASKLSCCAT